jgi:hypothetical protein
VDIEPIFRHPFTWGLVLGLVFASLALYRTFKLNSELKRFKRHLGEKLELDADTLGALKQKHEALRQENENLRHKIATYNEAPDRNATRNLEIFARAEKKMLISIPGFAGPWEQAKNEAVAEIESEESGRSVPKRLFSAVFGQSPRPQPASPAPQLPEKKEDPAG